MMALLVGIDYAHRQPGMTPSRMREATDKRFPAGRSWISVTGVISLLLGVVVIAGWHTHTVRLIQLHPSLVPMQYNTATCFLFCGLMLLAHCHGMRRMEFAFATVVALIGSLTLVEYVAGIDFGIDQLLLQHYITVETSHPGRMAPNTALSFFITSSAVLLSRRLLPNLASSIHGIFGSLVLGLAIAALLGYWLELEAAYGWGRWSRMAIHTALGFIALGSGLSLMAWESHRANSRELPRWLSFPAGVAVLTITFSLWQALHPARGISAVQGAQDLVLILGVALAAALGLAVSKMMSEIAARHQLELEGAERGHVEEKLLQYENIVSNSTDMLALIDKNYVYLAANEVYAKAFGKTTADIIGRTVSTLFGEEFFENTVRRNAERCLAGEDFQYHMWFDFPGHGMRYMDVLYSPYREPDGRIMGFVISGRDITEHQRLQQQLLQSQKMETVGQLAGGLAHDFNNMLAVVVGNAELAMEKLDPAESVHADLVEIHGAAMRSAILTQQLLAFARKQTIAPVTLDLNETLERQLKMMRRLMGENINLKWMPGEGIWPVKMDPSQLDQVLTNLCVNARDAIDDVGKVSIATDNAHFDEAYCVDHPNILAGDFVRLAVTDNGCGMDSQTLAKIFEPFFTTKDVGQGTGLGLAMVYGVVSQNGGFVDVHSKSGQGSTFEIYLPRQESVIEQDHQEFPKAVEGGSETVLLVEDEPAILKLTTIMLERLGYSVLAASTPSAAIKLAKEYQDEIHLLLTDVIMPDMNGWDLARKLQTLAPKLKKLFMSGFAANVISNRGVLDTDLHFIQKPFTREGLATKVQEALRDNSEPSEMLADTEQE